MRHPWKALTAPWLRITATEMLVVIDVFTCSMLVGCSPLCSPCPPGCAAQLQSRKGAQLHKVSWDERGYINVMVKVLLFYSKMTECMHGSLWRDWHMNRALKALPTRAPAGVFWFVLQLCANKGIIKHSFGRDRPGWVQSAVSTGNQFFKGVRGKHTSITHTTVPKHL